MCFGRPEHHRQEEIRRAAAEAGAMREIADRERRAQEKRLQAFQEAANKQQMEALKMISESSKQPFKTKTIADTTPIMRTKQKQPGTAASISSLRINRTPGTNINVGTSGTNIG